MSKYAKSVVRMGVIAAAVTLALLQSQEAWAQTYCVPTAIGVPALPPGTPKWPDWTTAPSGPYGGYDDPRWQGSLGNGTLGFGAHPDDQAEFRALTYNDGSKDYLVLMLWVKVDPGPAAVGDIAYLGLSDGAAASATAVSHVIKLVRSGIASQTGATPAAADLVLRYRDAGGNWNDVAPKPSWLTADTRIDQTCGGAPATCDTWIYRVRVPVESTATAANPTNGVKIPAGGFKLWYEMHVASQDAAATSYTTSHKFPDTASEPGGAPESYPDPSTWSSAKLGVGAGCATGISLTNGQIQVSNSGTTSGHEISVINANTFHARPMNNSTITYGDSEIEARFRIANWGSAIGDSPTWEDLPAPAVNCVHATGAGTTTVMPGNPFDLTCTWTLNANQRCTYRPDVYNTCSPMPPSRYHHQCIFVTLAPRTGAIHPAFFSQQSSWNNMEFVNASKFEREAEINIKGLTPTAGPTRDVYLYVKTENMPAVVPADGGGSQDAGTPNDARVARVPPQRKGRVTTKDAAVLHAQVDAGKLTYDQVAQIMPTYKVYVWYDSGSTAGSAKVLTPMPAFGYLVAHDGELTGWEHTIEGRGGAILSRIAPNFYRVGVPHNGSVKVDTTISTVDRNCSKFLGIARCCCNLANAHEGTEWGIFGTLALGLMVIARRRRRRSSSSEL
jgi:hypothetical protein